ILEFEVIAEECARLSPRRQEIVFHRWSALWRTGMRVIRILWFVVVAVWMGVVSAAEVDFRPAPEPIEFPAGMERGPFSGVGVDSQAKLYVLQRTKPPVLCFSRSGKFLRSWGDDLIGYGHGLSI